MQVDVAPPDEGPEAPRQTYNFAPSYRGLVYRGEYRRSADAQDEGGAPNEAHSQGTAVSYKLQTMQWGLVPSWSKRNPNYGSLMKTINCRDDSLSTHGGLWASIKGRKRCLVLAEGFYEWLRSGKSRIPHYVKRKDGKLMCLAGLWDCVEYDGSDTKHYTYTVITTDSNQQLKFLHDRMPVILDAGSDDVWQWLDTRSSEWTRDLQVLLKPFTGELDCYPVASEVGRVGNSSPTFVIPITSSENKSNIANYFSKPASAEGELSASDSKLVRAKNASGSVDRPRGVATSIHAGVKRQHPASVVKDEPAPKRGTSKSPAKPSAASKISATRTTSKGKGKATMTADQKITSFFRNSD
ncbi:hypothetical protein F5X68DRAFT_225267 [Plectosphaerella plurivora]|uniref:DUF159 domain protein n=1 Tax=Plectosphaerella plurivora TaxID=936078 RepID=A0A9P8UZY3_9PEZI|nr:hypothetical protein F5X68DRAFT_225267 [Plectosphaerella plurivora]